MKNTTQWIKGNFIVLSSMLFFGISACDMPECENTNPVFEENTKDAYLYKKTLANEIERLGKENIRYWVAGYTEKRGNTYIEIYLQGESLCAEAEILVEDWNKLKGIKDKRGKSYRGAELRGLEFDILKQDSSFQLVYKNVEAILD